MTQDVNQQEALRLVRQCLGSPYNEQRMREFTANLLPGAEQLDRGSVNGAYIPAPFRDHVVSYKRLAKIRDNEKLDVLAIKLKKGPSYRNARTMQRQFIASYLNGMRGGSLKDAALVAFYTDDDPDWRFSLVYKDYVFEDGKAREVLSEPKRASFLVGSKELTHTAEKQFVDLLQDVERQKIQRIRDAFSVERVTKEFFREYRGLFLELRNVLQSDIDSSPELKKEFSARGISASVYAKRLLGQIVFLYFLQKKGWLGVAKDENWGSGSHSFLQDLFKNNQDKDFFSKLLNPLFYDALATDRSASDHMFPLLKSRIPFLNGGLFEPLNGYDWKNTIINIPNSFFEKLFEVFDRFNFTVREDEPLESEVAVDPEMLGKVFEGLLDVEERREKGTFYTPRNIVQYMCRESLIQYLDRAVNLVIVYEEQAPRLPGMPAKPAQQTLSGVKTKDKSAERLQRENLLSLEDLRAFIRQDELVQSGISKTANKKRSGEYSSESNRELPEAIKRYASKLDKALADVKICDPAIGSGAFAVGMMHEIVRARQLLREACPEVFPDGQLDAYELKRNTIANSLYGVDIDPSAVDIAKLRLWLSLVVDENDFDRIKPLPNLDYKIMVGNSIDAARSKQDKNPLFNRENCATLVRLQREYFNITYKEQKNALRNKINELREQCGEIGNFDWYIDFANTAGSFDIVIGNPPYIQIQSLGNSIKKLKSLYETYSSTGDIYCLFYELGYNLLKIHGILAFITSNSWMRAGYGDSLRTYISTHAYPIHLIDFAGNKVFAAATVDVNILILEKLTQTALAKSGATSACIIKESCTINMSDYIERNAVFARFEVGQSWAILSPIEHSIKAKIEAVGKPLKEWDVRINYGIKTGFNEAFIINGDKKDELIRQDPKSAEIIRPILRGKDIKRYGYDFKDKWLICTHNGTKEKGIPPVNVENYPAIKAHLDKFYPALAKRQDKGITPYNLRNCAYMEDFSKQKIAWGEISDRSKFCFLENEFYLEATAFFMIGENLRYILTILNSKLGEWIFNQIGTTTGVGTNRWKKYKLENLYIKPFDRRYQDNIIRLQQSISTIDIDKAMLAIDMEVFEIYKLTTEEINFIMSLS